MAADLTSFQGSKYDFTAMLSYPKPGPWPD